jgi:hypothetical protein
MQSLWGIDFTTKGRALIVPKNGHTTVNLRYAAEIWTIIAKQLASGKSAAQAVAVANAEKSAHGDLEFQVINVDLGASLFIAGKH